MVFNSLIFIVFFVVVFFAYYAVPKPLQKAVLLLASVYFYIVYVPWYILILFFLVALDYTLALSMEEWPGYKKFFFLLSIVSNIGILFTFKYFSFFAQNIDLLAKTIHWNYSIQTLALVLPLGLSFHVFQSLAYTIEVYKGRFAAERNLFTYALYVLFFPQLVAGPIERPEHLLPQLRTAHHFNTTMALHGLKRMLWGFFKKVVIANNLAVVVDFVYSHAATANGFVILVAIIFFTIQLYADFSGYCDIALGSAQMLGITLVENFNHPFFSRSIAEFWRRWHISLSNWFRDYVYFPLAWYSSRLGKVGIYSAVCITFALTGVWHGAGWNFLCMGLLFGLYISFGMWSKQYRDSIARKMHFNGSPRVVFQYGMTFAFTSLAWVLFRAESFSKAVTVYTRLLTGWSKESLHFLLCKDYCAFYEIGIGRGTLMLICISILLLFSVEYVREKKLQLPRFYNRRSVRWGIYYGFIVWILFAGNFAPQTFIYFKF